MTEKWKQEKWADDIWYSGKVTRRSVIGWGGGAIGAMMLVPAPWRAAFGAEKAYKIGSEQPLSGAGAAGAATFGANVGTLFPNGQPPGADVPAELQALRATHVPVAEQHQRWIDAAPEDDQGEGET